MDAQEWLNSYGEEIETMFTPNGTPTRVRIEGGL